MKNVEQGSSLRIKVLYNNLGRKEGCSTDWGFSALVTMNGVKLIFDTGGQAGIFERNMRTLSVAPDDPKHIVISHEHWDHVNGLKYLAGKTNPSYTLYLPKQAFEKIPYTANFGSIQSVEHSLEISQNIWLTPEMVAEEKELTEIALVLHFLDKLYIVSGCSHSGIENIVSKALDILPGRKVGLVTGGFHIGEKSRTEILDISDQLKSMGVEKIAPSHCSGDLAIDIFRKEWGPNFIQLYLGDEFVLDSGS